MSLQAIFDPMVNAYFKKKYGGGGGNTGGGATAVSWRYGVEYPEPIEGMHHVSALTPTVEELSGGFLHIELKAHGCHAAM